MKPDIKEVVRDTGFIFLITFLSGFAFGVFFRDKFPYWEYAFLLCNYMTTFIGFSLVAYWTKQSQLNHLILIAILLWVVSMTETLLLGNVKGWLISGFITFTVMGLGWVFGVLVLKRRMGDR